MSTSGKGSLNPCEDKLGVIPTKVNSSDKNTVHMEYTIDFWWKSYAYWNEIMWFKRSSSWYG
jgi:hypothetical protein